MEKVSQKRTVREQQEIQRRILESIDREKKAGSSRRNSSRAEYRRRQEKRERRLRRECMVLGVIAAVLLVLLVMQKMSEKISGSILPSFMSSISGQTDLLILVNKDHALPEDYQVNEHWLNSGRVSVADEMYDDLSAMLTAGSEDGRAFVVASGYRSAAYQQQLLEEDIARDMQEYGMSWQEAYDLESMETMPAGHSEHETGLAVDLVSLDYQILDIGQEYTEENQWLREHCQDYGFILRYPKDKEEVTGIHYEPWHFRYVGKKAAKEIMARGITLEEYLAGK